VLAGVGLAAAIDQAAGGGLLTGPRLLLPPVAAGLMLVIGLLAALGPARQGLAVGPAEALTKE
jgi:hypothetical protein